MKIVKTAKTPTGEDIQIEDWSNTYDFMPYASTVAVYPIAQESGRGAFEPKIGERFRVEFDFVSADKADICFEQLKAGQKTIADFITKETDKKLLKVVANGN